MKNFIEPYHPGWKTEFESLKQVIMAELGEWEHLINIQHIGSTSIPGMPAKPVLDIDIIIDQKDLIKDLEPRLRKMGYSARGEQGIAGRFAFRQISDFTPHTAARHKWQTHHLYVCYADSLALKNHLLFRDTLLKNPALCEQYARLKRSLVAHPEMTREIYTRQKTDFIISVLANAGLSQHELDEITQANQ